MIANNTGNSQHKYYSFQFTWNKYIQWEHRSEQYCRSGNNTYGVFSLVRFNGSATLADTKANSCWFYGIYKRCSQSDKFHPRQSDKPNIESDRNESCGDGTGNSFGGAVNEQSGNSVEWKYILLQQLHLPKTGSSNDDSRGGTLSRVQVNLITTGMVTHEIGK